MFYPPSIDLSESSLLNMFFNLLFQNVLLTYIYIFFLFSLPKILLLLWFHDSSLFAFSLFWSLLSNSYAVEYYHNQEMFHFILQFLSALSLPFDFPHSDWVTLMASFHLTLRPSFLSPTQSTWVSVSLINAISADCASVVSTNVSILVLLSKPAVYGDHILLQWPVVRGSSTSASVGLRPHRHTTACNHYQPRWAKTHGKVSYSIVWLTVDSVNRCFWSCSDDGVSYGVAVVAGIR